MTRYILQRLALLPLLMVIYSFVIFVIIQAPPGDFLTAYVATLASSGSSISQEQIEAWRAQYGLDQPMIVQYWLWVKHLVHGTHTIFLGQVEQVLLGKKGRPLLYFEGQYAKLASLTLGEPLPEGLDYWGF